jgi:tetratricopeptide (TPR) repeat protein
MYHCRSHHLFIYIISQNTLLKGNEKFAEQDFEAASELYMQSLVGLDFGKDEMENKEARVSIQMPVLNNLTACYLKLRKFHRCILLADYAIQLEPSEAWKAYSRKGSALIELCDFIQARKCLREANSIAPSEQDRRSIKQELRRLLECENRAKVGDDKTRKALSSAMVRALLLCFFFILVYLYFLVWISRSSSLSLYQC